MDKRSIFERGLPYCQLADGSLLSAVNLCGGHDARLNFSGTNLMNLENITKPSGYATTTNPYGYDIGDRF